MSLGRWADADRVLADAVESGLSQLVVLGALIRMRGTIAALTGSYDDAARYIEAASAVMESRQVNQFALPFAFLRWSRSGGATCSSELVRRALETEAEDFLGQYLWPVIWLGLRIEAKEAEPQSERAEALRTLAAEVPATTPSTRAYQALAAAEGAPATVQSTDWADAVEASRRSGDPYPLAYALLRRSAEAVGVGDRDGAAAMLQEATLLASQTGAQPLPDETQRLARHGVRGGVSQFLGAITTVRSPDATIIVAEGAGGGDRNRRPWSA
jgi:hypothetical protein